MGPTTVSYDTMKVRFRKFENEDLGLVSWSGTPVAVDESAFWSWYGSVSGAAPESWQRNSSAVTPPQLSTCAALGRHADRYMDIALIQRPPAAGAAG